MKEAQITCLCTRLQLPDLGLVMVKGQVEHVDLALANKSKDLAQARRNRGVEVREVQRVRERRSVAKQPANAPASRPTQRPVQRRPPPAAPDRPIVVEAKVDMGEVARIVRMEVTGALKDAILAGGPARPYSIGSSIGPPAPAGEIHVPEPEPTFIPSGIVDKGAKTDIKVEAEETEASGLDAAAKALKGRKKKSPTRKRATKKKKDSEK